MFVAGLLVAISRLHERRYRLLLLFFVVLLLPALLTTVGVPNAARAFAAAPIVLTLAALGISYMLELWYRTSPINSAARTTGQIRHHHSARSYAVPRLHPILPRLGSIQSSIHSLQ